MSEKITDAKYDNTLHVNMFDTFSMSYNGVLITGRSKTSESQFMYLMQILLHAGKNGVGRDRLEQALFRNKDLNNIHHATQSVIYNAKKKLKASGLPDVNYIEQKEGTYYWTHQIPVLEDTAEFERLYKEAEAEEDKQKKLDLYLDAVHHYTGEFLQSQISLIWAAKEARRYRLLFCDCVEKAAQLLREKEDFTLLEDLGNYATRVHPLADWETLTMEAYVALGRYEDAAKLYENTVDYYLQEQGMRPSEKMLQLLNKLGTQMEHQYDVLDEIQLKLTEDDPGAPGGYQCSYPVFLGIYHVIERMMERGGQSVFLMLCTIVDSKGNPMRSGPQLDELSERLGKSIQKSIRRSDVVNKYGKGQYLVLLANTTLENCKVVQKRINHDFIIGRQRTGVRYYVNSVILQGANRA